METLNEWRKGNGLKPPLPAAEPGKGKSRSAKQRRRNAKLKMVAAVVAKARDQAAQQSDRNLTAARASRFSRRRRIAADSHQPLEPHTKKPRRDLMARNMMRHVLHRIIDVFRQPEPAKPKMRWAGIIGGEHVWVPDTMHDASQVLQVAA